jgi:hypothetical protein
MTSVTTSLLDLYGREAAAHVQSLGLKAVAAELHRLYHSRSPERTSLVTFHLECFVRFTLFIFVFIFIVGGDFPAQAGATENIFSAPYIGRYENAYGVVEVTQKPATLLSSSPYEISISVVRASGCSGGLEAQGYLKNGEIEFVTKPDFDQNGNVRVCKVLARADLASKELNLEERGDRTRYHGASCGFKGVYQRAGEARRIYENRVGEAVPKRSQEAALDDTVAKFDYSGSMLRETILGAAFTAYAAFSLMVAGLIASIVWFIYVKSKKTTAKDRDLALSAKIDARYYIKRIPLFLGLLIASGVLQHFFYWGAFRAVAADVILSSFFILGVVVFSPPLGFRRKVACWTLGLLAIIIPAPTVAGLFDWLTHDVDTFRFLWGRSPMVSGASIMIGTLVTLLVQKKWREYLARP